MMKGLTALGVDMELAEKAKKRNFILALAFTIGLIAGIPCIVVGATNMGDNKGSWATTRASSPCSSSAS